MYICHVFKEDDIRVNYLPCTYYIKLILAGSVEHGLRTYNVYRYSHRHFLE